MNTQDVVDAVLYMTDSKFTSGTVLPVDGGDGRPVVSDRQSR